MGGSGAMVAAAGAGSRANFNVQFQYGLALEHLGQTRDAMSHYAAALLENPDFPDALQHLAWIAATDAEAELRNGTQAVELARPRLRIDGAEASGDVADAGGGVCGGGAVRGGAGDGGEGGGTGEGAEGTGKRGGADGGRF